jgi:hypothetical protein
MTGLLSRRRAGGWLVVLALLTLSGCFRQIPAPDIKQNPARHEHYQLTMTLRDAPGPYDSIGASVQYSVSNSHCVPLTPISGAALAPNEHVSLPMTQVGPNAWTADFYADLFMDEDYYHLGVCNWSMVAVSFGPTVKGNSFNGFLSHDDLLAGTFSTTTYFATQLYLTPFDTPTGISGSPSPSHFKEPDKHFSVILTAVKMP